MNCNLKKIIKFINIILYNFSVSAQEVELSTNISICDASNRLHKIYISDTTKCTKNQPTHIRHCKTRVYNSIESTLKINSIRCYFITERYSSTNFFFFSSISKKPRTCSEMSLDFNHLKGFSWKAY